MVCRVCHCAHMTLSHTPLCVSMCVLTVLGIIHTRVCWCAGVGGCLWCDEYVTVRVSVGVCDVSGMSVCWCRRVSLVYDDYSFTYLTIFPHIFTTAPPRSYVPSICVYMCLYVSIYVCVPTFPSMSVCGCLWVSVGVWCVDYSFTYLYFCSASQLCALYVCLCLSMSLYLCLCPSIYIYVSLCPYIHVYISLCPSIYVCVSRCTQTFLSHTPCLCLTRITHTLSLSLFLSFTHTHTHNTQHTHNTHTALSHPSKTHRRHSPTN